MLNRVIKVACTMVVAAWAVHGHADIQVGAPVNNDFSNHYVEGFASREGLGKRQTLGVYGARAAWPLDQHFHVRGSVAALNAAAQWRGGNTVSPALRGERITAGGGFNTPLQEGLDMQISAELQYQSLRARGGTNRRELGVLSKAGVRHQTHDVVELSGGLRVNAMQSTRVGLYGEALLSVADEVDVGVEIFTEGGREAASLLLRYNF